MNILLEIINSLNKEESRFYKIFAGRTNSGAERKDLLLFDFIKQNGEEYREDEISEELYKDNKNSFYQLKNRLYKDLNKSMMLQHMGKEKDIFILHFVLLSRIYKRKGKVELCFHYLQKAEKEAENIEAYELLSIIYSEILTLSYDMVSINVEKYIEKKRENNERLNWVQEIDLLLAAVMYRIKTAQNFSTNDETVNEVLQKTLDSFSKNEKIPKSPKFRVKVYQVVSRILLQQHDFQALEEYLIHTYEEFTRNKIFTKSNHEQKLTMLAYLTNCLFKTHKYKQSLVYAEKLKISMNEYDGFLRDKYLFYHYNALVINYSLSNKEKALEVLKEAKRNDVIQQLPTFSVFIYLNTALIYYDQVKLSLAVKNLSRLILQDDFVNIGKSFQLKIHIAELIVRFDLNQTDVIDSRVKHIKKTFKDLLKDSNFKRDKQLVEIIDSLVYCNNLSQDKKLVKKITELSILIEDEKADDIDVINYNVWLKSLR
jgi:tetratricopeptide (TPR) repeat protein